MKPNPRIASSPLIAMIAGLALVGALQAAPVIYEPFADSDATLTGNTPGTGLSGTWSSTAAVQAGSVFYGSLAHSGNKARFVSGSSSANVALTKTNPLTDISGLLDDGDTLWFSVVHTTNTSVGSTNPDAGFAIGTTNLSGSNALPMNTGGNGNGFGFTVQAGQVRAARWSGGTKTQAAGAGVSSSTNYLILGKIEFSADGVSGDTVKIYLPAADLSFNEASPVSTTTLELDQTTFTRLSFAAKADNLPNQWDEIRFGATSADVLPVDDTAPVIASTTPTDDNGNAGRYVLKAVFDESVSAGTGDIRIVNDSDTVTTTIPIGDSQVSIAGTTVTITLTTPLLPAKNYHVEIDAGAVKNGANLDFGGIADATTWNFTTTADDIAPTIASTSPADNATGVAPYATLVATFSEGIQLTGTGTVTIKDLATPANNIVITLPNSRVSVSGTDLSINLFSDYLDPSKQYAVQISGNSLLDLNLNPFAGIADDTTWNFTTAAAVTGGGVVVAPAKINGTPTFGITGTLYAIDVPYFASIGAAGPTVNGPLGRDWPVSNDVGWAMASGSGLEADHGQSPWEPDGTPVAQARTYRLFNAAGSSYAFNLPDGAVINGIYATWLSRGTSGAVWSYTEGGPTVSNSVSMTVAPTADLKLDWTDAIATVRTGNFQRVLAGPVTVVGGNGFTLNCVRTGNTHQADAVVLDVTLPGGGSPEIAVDQGGDIANGGSKDFGTVTLGSNTSLTFTINNTGTAALNLTGTAPDYVAVSGTHASDFTVTSQPASSVAGPGSSTFTVQFTPGGTGARNAVLTILNNDGDEGTFTINVSGTGQTKYQAWAGGAPFSGDANNDGVTNGMAFLLGAGSPTSAVTLPTVTEVGGNLILNFNCLPIAARGGASLKVAHSSDLGVLDPWTATAAVVPDATNAVPDNNVTFVVGAGPVGPPALNSVTATIGSAAAAGNRLFGRLQATE